MLVQELKARIKVIVVNMLLLMSILLIEREKLLYILRELLGGRLVEVSILDTFKVLIELMLILVMIISIPYILIQMYMYICQGLYLEEQRRVQKIIIVYIILWLIGISTFKICYINIREMLFSFRNVGIEEVETVESVLANVRLINKVLVSVLMVYQIPLLIQVSVYLKVLNGIKILKYRKYYILGIVILIMFINGIEVLSNMVLIVCFILIYECLGIKTRLKEIRNGKTRKRRW